MRESGLVVSSNGSRRTRALGASIAFHGLAIVTIALLRGLSSPSSTPKESVEPSSLTRLIWYPAAGAPRGGGGGGEKSQAQARQLQRPGRQALSVPAPPPRIESRPVAAEREPEPLLDIPANSLAASTELARGVLEATSGDAVGPGPGDGDGSGPGEGSGLGRGSGGNFGDDPRQPGFGGVTMPLLLHQVKPTFTSEAMRSRVSGIAVLECVVNRDGSVGAIRIVRSLDDRYGLDERAIDALRQWRFKPGTLAGEPVPVLVRVELTFSLR